MRAAALRVASGVVNVVARRGRILEPGLWPVI